jgi:peroxiredoxin
MRSLVLTLTLIVTILATASAVVVRLAPDFALSSVAGKGRSLKSFRGQPVVLVIAKSPKDGDFKQQAKFFKEIYQVFASKQVVFIAAFTEHNDPITSEIPFVVAENGAAVAGAYGVVDKFNIVIIGKDGNVDYQTKKVLPPERVHDVIQNSYEIQANTGR